jgi:hypothetical protein
MDAQSRSSPKQEKFVRREDRVMGRKRRDDAIDCSRGICPLTSSPDRLSMGEIEAFSLVRLDADVVMAQLKPERKIGHGTQRLEIILKNAFGFYLRGHRARRENSLRIIPFS